MMLVWCFTILVPHHQGGAVTTIVFHTESLRDHYYELEKLSAGEETIIHKFKTKVINRIE
jgi:hypothetical protein